MMAQISKPKTLICGAIFVVSASMFSFEAHAQAIRSVFMNGTGTDSCAVWIKDREASDDTSKQKIQQRIEWFTGFLSAVNLFAEPSGNLPGGLDDKDGMLAWIDSHCRTNPNDPLFVAAADFVFDLRNHPRNRTGVAPPAPGSNSR